MTTGRELGSVLKNISLLYGVKPEESIVEYNKQQMGVLREMTKEKGYGSLFLSPEIHERTVNKLYNLYEEKFN